MKVGLYFDKTLETLEGELYVKLTRKGIDAVEIEKGIDQNPNISGIDVLVFHPPYDNEKGEWDAVRKFIDAHQNTLFYMLALGASEREVYFGERKNLIYINNGDFFRNLTKCINDGYKHFSRK